MAELAQINGETYKKRGPLGVLGLTIITFGIYYFYWYYQANDELRRYERDGSISPTWSRGSDPGATNPALPPRLG